MIIMPRRPVGQMGNQLFQFNLIWQLSNLLTTPEFHWGFSHLPSIGLPSASFPKTIDIFRKYKSINEEDLFNLATSGILVEALFNLKDSNFIIEPGIMGKLFFQTLFHDPHQLFEKRQSRKIERAETSVGLHFRGRDFSSWNPKSIMTIYYYMNAVDSITAESKKKVKIKLFTDDPQHEVVSNLKKDKRIEISVGQSVASDFYKLGASDYIVASPSTFAFWASLTNKESKVVYAKEWVDQRISLDDNFWLNYSTNEKYGIKIHETF